MLYTNGYFYSHTFLKNTFIVLAPRKTISVATYSRRRLLLLFFCLPVFAFPVARRCARARYRAGVNEERLLTN